MIAAGLIPDPDPSAPMARPCSFCGMPVPADTIDPETGLCRFCIDTLPRPTEESTDIPGEVFARGGPSGFSGMLAAYGLQPICGGSPEEEDDGFLGWLAKSQPKPTDAEMDKAIAHIMSLPEPQPTPEQAELDRLRAVNAELLAACKSMLESYEVLTEEVPAIKDRPAMLDVIRGAFLDAPGLARAAIAKAQQ
jgi:hypothetical protein